MKRSLIIRIALLLSLLPAVSFAESYTFSNTTSVVTDDYQWNSSTPAAVNTTSLDISDTSGSITDLNATLNGVNSGGLIDMTFVLVGPDNTGVVLASHAGGGGSTAASTLTDTDITFDDSASSQIAQADSYNSALSLGVAEGSYQTSAYNTRPAWHTYYGYTALLNPVESGIFGDVDFAEENLLAAFNDISANGTWTLLAYDNLSEDVMSLSGWTLDFETTGSSGGVPEPAEWALICICALGLIGLKLFKQQKSLQNF